MPQCYILCQSKHFVPSGPFIICHSNETLAASNFYFASREQIKHLSSVAIHPICSEQWQSYFMWEGIFCVWILHLKLTYSYLVSLGKVLLKQILTSEGSKGSIVWLSFSPISIWSFKGDKHNYYLHHQSYWLWFLSKWIIKYERCIKIILQHSFLNQVHQINVILFISTWFIAIVLKLKCPLLWEKITALL